MDLRFSQEERLPRRGAHLLPGRTCRPRSAEAGRGPPPSQGRHGRLAAHPEQPRAGPCRTGRRSGAAPAGRRCSTTSSTRSCRSRRVPQPLAVRRHHGRAGDHHLRHRGAEEALPAAHRQPRRLVVPGLLRARRRLRPRLAQDHGRARGRPLHRQRPEDLDHAGAVRRLDLLPVRTDPDGQEAGGHLLPADRHEDARASPCARS